MKKFFMSQLICIMTLVASPFVYASAHCSPFYLGAELGGGNLHYDHSHFAVNTATVDDKGFAGRLLAGVDINQNIGLELGYIRYHNPKFTYFDDRLDFSQQSFDLLAKVSLPVSCSTSLYVKGGLAYVTRDDIVPIKSMNTDDHVRPLLGVGLSYGFTARVTGNVGYYRTFGTDDLEDADFYGVGFTYRVG